MSLEQFTNLAHTTLNGAINNVSTSLVVASASGFPTSGNFRIMIDTEILLVTAVSGTTFTVVRGYEGTTALAHLDFSQIQHVLTKNSLYQYPFDRGLSRGLGTRNPATPGTYDNEFTSTVDALPTGWSWASAPSGSNAWTVNSTYPSMLMVEGNGNTAYVMSKTFAPGNIDFGLWWKILFGPSRVFNETALTISLYNTSESEAQQWSLLSYNREVTHVWGSKIVSSSASGGFGSTVGVQQDPGQTVMFGGLTRTSGNVWSMWYSDNGIAWQQYYNTETHAFTIDHVSVAFDMYSVPTRLMMDWMRYRNDLNFPRL